jgi:hypothetical protein
VRLSPAARAALLDVIWRARAQDAHNWDRLERATRAGAGPRIERTVVQLGSEMGDLLDALSLALEAARLVTPEDTTTDDSTVIPKPAVRHAS